MLKTNTKVSTMENEVTVCTVKKKRKPFGSDQRQLLGMQIPGLLLIFVFCYLPMIGLVIAFKDYRYNLGMFKSPWIGFQNFKFLFESDTLWVLIRNTIGYNAMFIIGEIIVCLTLAILMYGIKEKLSIKIFQSSLFLPYFLSWVVVSYVSHALLSMDFGLINSIRAMFGMDKISFYSEPKYWPGILLFFDIWKHVGYKTLVYYGSLLSLDTSLMEAAAIDGCTYFKRIRYIIIPHLTSTIIILLILSIGGIFRSDFGMFFYLPKDAGVLYDVTDVLDTYIMRSIRVAGNLGASSAAGLLQSVVGFILVVITNAIVKRNDEDNALF